MEEQSLSLDRFGWASVQMDGGIENVKEKVEEFFAKNLGLQDPQHPQHALQRENVGLEYLKLGLLSPKKTVIPSSVAKAFAMMTRLVVEKGGFVGVPENQAFLTCSDYMNEILNTQLVEPSLLYGQSFIKKGTGFHIMQCPSSHWIETLTGTTITSLSLSLSLSLSHSL